MIAGIGRARRLNISLRILRGVCSGRRGWDEGALLFLMIIQSWVLACLTIALLLGWHEPLLVLGSLVCVLLLAACLVYLRIPMASKMRRDEIGG